MAIHIYPASWQTELTEPWTWGVKERNQEWFPSLGLEQLEGWGCLFPDGRAEVGTCS